MLSPFYRFLNGTFLSFFFLLNTNPGYSQDAIKVAANNAVSNDSITTLLNHYIYKVDSIGHTNGVAGHFARIYTISMSNIGKQLQNKDSGAQNFIKRFEISFINFFVTACIQFEKGQSPGPVWSNYFSNAGAESWQLMIIGINAHINGDIWQGLVKNFSAEEIRRYSKDLMSFQTAISKAFQPFFEEMMAGNSYLRFINGFTKGAPKQYGEWLIWKWRKRQINLAILYFTDPEKYKRKFAVINRKKKRIDKIILQKRKIIL